MTLFARDGFGRVLFWSSCLLVELSFGRVGFGRPVVMFTDYTILGEAIPRQVRVRYGVTPRQKSLHMVDFIVYATGKR
jgi:hypothetical protein